MLPEELMKSFKHDCRLLKNVINFPFRRKHSRRKRKNSVPEVAEGTENSRK